ANTSINILDDAIEPVPIGVLGEIFIGGVNVGRGYLGRADMTGERYIPDPYSDEKGARLYRTGDIGRYTTDGNIECVGRKDQQVKIRGFRIELGEIESVITAHPHINEVVVIVREDSPGDKRLVAYIVPDHSHQLLVPDLRRFVAAKLPDYMIPA